MCCIGGADISIVFKPERLESPISVEGIHGSPANSKVRLDGYGFICILDVSVVYDGVLIEHGLQLRKSKGKVEIKPPRVESTWLSLSLDPDGRAYLHENLLVNPLKLVSYLYWIHLLPWIFGMHV